jgi:predicted HicB family RNase H-like nuclease
MSTRWLHFRIEEELHERVREAAEADRRSVSNWVAVACERALENDPQLRAVAESEAAQ